MSGHCRVLPLEVSRSSVRFRWESQPAHPAWNQSEFTLEYEPDVDLTLMPRALLWTVFLGCTHPIWSLLDGYDVEFVEPMAAVELEFWGGMAAASRSASGVPALPEGIRPVCFSSSG